MNESKTRLRVSSALTKRAGVQSFAHVACTAAHVACTAALFACTAALFACTADLPGGGATPEPDAGSDGNAPIPNVHCPEAIAGQKVDSLATAATSASRLIGAAVNIGAYADDAMYKQILNEEFNFVTAESAMKWGQIEPNIGEANYDTTDAFVREACLNGQEIRGHALVWYFDVPAALEDLSAEALQTQVDRFVTETVERYRGAINHWDVVNEAIGDESGFRDSVFLRKLGEQHIARAFRLAREADPNAQLGYNDYNIIAPTPKSDRVYQLVSQMVADGVPIDYVGLQTHVTAFDALGGQFTEEDVAANLKRFTDLGLDVYITEMDVRVRGLAGDANSPQRESYRRIAAACVANHRCKGITLWGFTDRYSWIDGVFGEDDPLVFDEAFAKKPAYFGLVDGLTGVVGEAFPDACSSNPGDALLCDGFEFSVGWNPSINGSPGNGSVEFTPASARAGNQGIAAITSADTNQAALTRGLGTDYEDGNLYIKAHLKVLPNAADNVIMLGVNSNTSPFPGIQAMIVGGNIAINATTAGQTATGGPFTEDVYRCVQLNIAIGDNGSVDLLVDGVTEANLANIDTSPLGGLGGAAVGIIFSSAGGAEVHADDVIISRNPTNCD